MVSIGVNKSCTQWDMDRTVVGRTIALTLFKIVDSVVYPILNLIAILDGAQFISPLPSPSGESISTFIVVDVINDNGINNSFDGDWNKFVGLLIRGFGESGGSA